MMEPSHLFQDTVVIKRATIANSTSGEIVKTFSTLATVKGSVRLLNGDERLAADKLTKLSTHRLYVSPTDILETDVVSITTGDHIGEYNILYVDKLQVSGVFYQIFMQLVE